MTGLLPGTAPAVPTEDILGDDQIPTEALDQALQAAAAAAAETEKEALSPLGLTAGKPVTPASLAQSEETPEPDKESQ